MNHHENKAALPNSQRLNQVAGRMRIFGYLLILSVIIPLLVSGYDLFTKDSMSPSLIGNMAVTAISAVVYLTIALLTLWASAALRAASRTKSNEVSHIIHALDSMKRLFAIQYWMVVVFLALTVLAFITTVLAMTTML